MNTAEPAGQAWKVGALAQATGLTVRALHHYDHIGLLTPSRRTTAGHRLYTSEDVARLYRLTLLRRLGFPLDQIAGVLEDPQWQLPGAIERHLEHTRQRAAIAARLCNRLAGMSAGLAADDGNPSPDQLFATLEEMTMLDESITSTAGSLVYEDVAAAHDYIVRVFGLTPGPVVREEKGNAIHAEVHAGDHVIWLHRVTGEYKSPRALGGVSSMTIVTVDDVDAHYARSVQAGADIIEEPADQRYGVREYGARDLEGHHWYFHSPLP